MTFMVDCALDIKDQICTCLKLLIELYQILCRLKMHAQQDVVHKFDCLFIGHFWHVCYIHQKFPLESEDSILTSTLKQFSSYLDDVSTLQRQFHHNISFPSEQ